MALQGKPTPERGFANFMTGVLNGVATGTGMAREQRQEQRSAETQAVQIKASNLAQQIEQAKFDEWHAMSKLREQQAQATLKATLVKDPIQLQQLKIKEAEWRAKIAEAQYRKAQLEADEAQQINELTTLLETIRRNSAGQFETGSAPSEGNGDLGAIAPEGVDTRDMPALEPGVNPLAPPAMVPGVVPGGRRVLTGPPKLGDVMEEEATYPRIEPGDVARTILPPGVPPEVTERKIPIQKVEVAAALKAKDVNDALLKLMSGEGNPFGAAAEKKKRENPPDYLKDVITYVNEHQEQNASSYKALKSDREDRLRARVIEILNDPNERAVQSLADVDAAASQAVSEFAVKNLIDQNATHRIRPYLSMDAVNDGNVARYSGKLLNQAMDDTFGPGAQTLRFAEDNDYTLRQIVEALYTDEYHSNKTALLGFTQPFLPTHTLPSDHKLLQLFDTYWEPVRKMDRNTEQRRIDRNQPQIYNPRQRFPPRGLVGG